MCFRAKVRDDGTESYAFDFDKVRQSGDGHEKIGSEADYIHNIETCRSHIH